MATGGAQYFHACLYKFGDEAKQAVVTDFCTTISDVSAACWYDAENDIFCLTCPTSIGPQVNDVLGNAISKYIERELACASREERQATVTSFQEAESGEGFGREDVGVTALTEPTSSPSKSQPVKTNHTVVRIEPSNGSLKFFKLRDLPFGMLERVLTSDKQGSKKLFESGLTCRTARWSDQEGCYHFNGRIGIQLDSTSDDAYHSIITTNSFIPIQSDQRRKGDSDNHTSTVRVKTFDFKGVPPSVQQFLEGMGDVEPVEPEYMPQPPHDAEKFQKQPLRHMPIPGEAKVSKAPTAATAANKPGSDTDESEDENVPFMELIASKEPAAASKRRKERNAQLGWSAPPGSQPSEQNVVSPLNDNRSDRTAKPSRSQPQTASVAASSQTEMSQDSLGRREHKQHLQAITASERVQQTTGRGDHDYFPEHSHFAKVDNAGLTSNATNQATWEHANPSPRKPKANRSGISRRTAQMTGSSTSTDVESTFDHASLTSIVMSSMSASPKQLGCVDPRTEDTPWVNKVNRQTAASENLIDDAAPPTTSSLKPPPGFDFQQQLARQVQESRRKAPTSVPIDHETPNLIDFAEDVKEDTKPTTFMPPARFAQLLSSQKASIGAPAQQYTPDNDIQERLQPQSPEKSIKRNTMRQKGPKHRKGHGSVRNTVKPAAIVNLPKPDPVPLPQAKQVKQKVAETKTSTASLTQKVPDTQAKSLITTDGIVERALNSGEMMDQSHQPTSSLHKILQEVKSDNIFEPVEIHVQFGIILVKHLNDKTYLDGVRNAAKMESKLNQTGTNLHTDFIQRLTTSELDAQYLLSLADHHKISTKVEYDIHIKTTAGETRILRFEQSTATSFTVFRTDNVMAAMFMHYPMHVWDAQAIITKPQPDDNMKGAFSEFVKSIQSKGEAPSFDAKVPSHLFSIQSVYVKRVFTQRIANIEAKVVEVQDLLTNPVNSGDCNFEAIAVSKQTMIEDQRLWWEFGLHVDSAEVDTVAQLQDMVDGVVSRIDGVGYENAGPFVSADIEEPVQSVIGDGKW